MSENLTLYKLSSRIMASMPVEEQINMIKEIIKISGLNSKRIHEEIADEIHQEIQERRNNQTRFSRDVGYFSRRRNGCGIETFYFDFNHKQVYNFLCNQSYLIVKKEFVDKTFKILLNIFMTCSNFLYNDDIITIKTPYYTLGKGWNKPSSYSQNIFEPCEDQEDALELETNEEEFVNFISSVLASSPSKIKIILPGVEEYNECVTLLQILTDDKIEDEFTHIWKYYQC